MKKYISIPVTLIIMGILLLPKQAVSQIFKGNDDLEKSSIRLNTNFLSQNSHQQNFGLLSNDFYKNPLIGVEMDYKLSDHFLISAGISYEGAKETAQYQITFVIPPSPDALTSFQNTYAFRNFSLEPKAKLNFSLQKFDFFWGAGPIVSAAFLSSEYEAAPYKDPDEYSYLKSHNSASLGIGAQAFTGLQYLFNQHFGLSVEVGYRHLEHHSLDVEEWSGGENIPFGYSMKGVFNRVGLVYKF